MQDKIKNRAEILSGLQAGFGQEQARILTEMVSWIQELEKELETLKAQPLALEWVSPVQAGLLLKRSAPTVRKLARAGAFAIDENPGYQKGSRKMEYYLPGLRKYLFRQNLKPEAIEARINKISNH